MKRVVFTCLLISLFIFKINAQSDVENLGLQGHVKAIHLKIVLEKCSFDFDSVVSKNFESDQLTIYNRDGYILKEIGYDSLGNKREVREISRDELNRKTKEQYENKLQGDTIRCVINTAYNYSKKEILENLKIYKRNKLFKDHVNTYPIDESMEMEEILSPPQNALMKNKNHPAIKKRFADEKGNWTYCIIMKDYAGEAIMNEFPSPPPPEFENYHVYYRYIEYWQ